MSPQDATHWAGRDPAVPRPEVGHSAALDVAERLLVALAGDRLRHREEARDRGVLDRVPDHVEAVGLEPEPAYTSDLFAIHRYFPSLNPNLGDLARNLRFDPDYPATRRVACLTLDTLPPNPGPAQDQVLGTIIENVRSLGANVVVIEKM